ASMYSRACLPRSVPSLTFCRKMSPVEILGTERCADTNWACVPFPAPGGPTRTSLIAGGPLPKEALVVAQHQLALDLLRGVQADAYEDQDGGTAERELVGRAE